MELTFRTEAKTKNWRYLLFLPKELRPLGVLSLGNSLVMLLLLLVFYFPLQSQVPLFYSLPSDQQLVNKQFLFILPFLSILINLAHFLIMKFNKEIHEYVLKMFVQLTFLLQVLLLAILLRVIIIVS
jgi:hypothetical protein